MDRSVDAVAVRQHFLIVCEGSKTEPQYFKQFRVPRLVVKVEGLGMNTLSLVDRAIELSKEDEYDQVWCVFDKDDFPIDNFNNAINRANTNDLQVAYSNQAFELWYVLHFEFLQSAIDRAAYMRKLDSYLQVKYKKNDSQIYKRLRCKIDTAIRNATRLLSEYPIPCPGRDDPSTTVHELVKALLDQSKPLDKRME